MRESLLQYNKFSTYSSPLGRNNNFAEAELLALKDAYSMLPGGALGGNALSDDCRFVFDRGDGAYFWDLSNNIYIDYCLGSGPLVLGHAHHSVTSAVKEQAEKGLHFFAYLNKNAVELARLVLEMVPCAERIRFTNSGSEATFHAIRLARAATKREKILKFEGAYHGHHDYAQISTTPQKDEIYLHGEPDSAGIPEVVQKLMLVAPYNNLEITRSLVEKHAKDIAAIIVEPIQRIISPVPGFLEGLREIADKNDIILIFDEVVTGFRFGAGGAQEYFKIRPDLCTLGKIIGGGSPLGAVAGRADIMDLCDPRHKGEQDYVYQNGTLQGNPLSTAIALSTINELRKPGFYQKLFERGEAIRDLVTAVLKRHNLPAICFGEGPMWHILFASKVPKNHRDVMAADKKALMHFDSEMIRKGLFVLPGNRRFISICHNDDVINKTASAMDEVCRSVKYQF